MSPTDRRPFAAALGFAFVAAWAGLGAGSALLCLLGAAAFWGGAAFLQGSVDLGELQARFAERTGTGTAPGRAAPRVR